MNRVHVPCMVRVPITKTTVSAFQLLYWSYSSLPTRGVGCENGILEHQLP